MAIEPSPTLTLSESPSVAIFIAEIVSESMSDNGMDNTAISCFSFSPLTVASTDFSLQN